MSVTRVFYDSEFTGLTSKASLISLAMITECGLRFYAEFTDYNRSLVDEFVRDNVLTHTRWLKSGGTTDNAIVVDSDLALTTCVGTSDFVRNHVELWLGELGSIQMWADHVSYDWVLFCELFGGALHLPKDIHYIPMDLCTFLVCHGYDSDCDRVQFAKEYVPVDTGSIVTEQHNALYDAETSLGCFRRVIAETELVL